MHLHRTTPQRDDRGVVAIELVLILPFLLMIIVGILAVGNVVSLKAQGNELAREGARAAALHKPLPAGASIAPSSTACPTPNDPTKFVKVQAIKNVSLRSIPIIGVDFLPATITETVTMRCGG